MNITKRKIGGFIVGCIVVVSGLLTIDNDLFDWWDLQRLLGNSTEATSSVQPTAPPVDAVLAITPTPVPDLNQMLDSARSLNRYSERDRALRIVARTAVEWREYHIAIKAAAASPTYAERAETLVSVARCAIEEELFDLADEAANKIPIYKIEDSTKIEILNARNMAAKGSTYSIEHPVQTTCPW